jgi:hypothetical protein
MKHKNLLLLISLCLLVSIRAAAPTDFTLFPEDTALTTDFLFANKVDEFFYSAYYFANSGSNLYDYRNGIYVTRYSDVK